MLENSAPFRWWFTSGKFPADWSLRQLETTLGLHGTVDAPATIGRTPVRTQRSSAAPLPSGAFPSCSLQPVMHGNRATGRSKYAPFWITLCPASMARRDNLPLRWCIAWARREKTTGMCWSKPYPLRLPKACKFSTEREETCLKKVVLSPVEVREPQVLRILTFRSNMRYCRERSQQLKEAMPRGKNSNELQVLGVERPRQIGPIVHSMPSIFREISKDDFGIDGEIEIVVPRRQGRGF